MADISNKKVGKDRPHSDGNFSNWLQKNHPELIDLYVAIDRKMIANPGSLSGKMAWLISLAYECGSLNEIREAKKLIRGNRKELELLQKLQERERYFNHRNSFDYE